MAKNAEEKRSYPRIKTGLKLKITETVPAESIDVSEGGLSFNATEKISSPTISLRIEFPHKELELKTNAKLVWQRNLEDGSSSYGVEFIELNEAQKTALRKELIKTQISGLLNEIKGAKMKEDVSRFFFKDMFEHINGMNTIVSQLPKDNTYSRELENKITHMYNQIVLKGYCLEELLADNRIIEKVKDNFRKLVGGLAYKSPITKRAFEKPRGYPDDYAMLETVYNNEPLAKSGIAVYLDKYFLDSPYAVAVRYRKDKLKEILRLGIQQSHLRVFKVFDIACGSCREIKELPFNIFEGKTAIFSCLDWDEEALGFSRQAINGFPENVKFNFIKEDIVDLIKNPSTMSKFEKQDLVYSIGLIDYLPDRILKMFIQYFFSLLKANGKLILTHKNREKTFSPLAPDWYCDWKFVPRNKEEVTKLFYDSGIKNFFLTSEVDDFNDIFYFTLNKTATYGT